MNRVLRWSLMVVLFFTGCVAFAQSSSPSLGDYARAVKKTKNAPASDQKKVYDNDNLPANSTIGYDDFSYLVVTKVNGKEVHSLGELAAAVKTPINGFDVIETADDPKQLELDIAQVAAEAGALQKNYGLPALQRLP